MAKNKVINTVLNLRDNMSGGLLKAAQNAKKSGAKIDNSMIQSTRKVIAFKNKAVSAMQEFAKKSALAAGAAVGGLARRLCGAGRRDRGIPRGAGQAEHRL